MTTENTDYEAPGGGARIEELPASDMQMRSEDRDSSRRVPPPEGPEDIASPAPDPGDPEDPADFQREAPPPRDPDDE
ncbi:MAG TPA: hypothetical protein VFS77_14135 [Pyrinomonadaceae bacterium]|nr:hypothetical protein [Pyrinomonadaceae bacterium]